MEYRNVLLKGFEAVTAVPGKPGVLLQRIPEESQSGLAEETQKMLMRPAGNEIRLVPLEQTVQITFTSYQNPDEASPTIACVFYGDFQGQTLTIGETMTTLSLEIPEHLKTFDPETLQLKFHPQVIRIMLFYGNVHLIDITGKTRAPYAHEMPDKTLLFYGTSITHGKAAWSPLLTIPQLTAWRLGCDSINLGVAGSAVCEPEMAHYIASRNDFDALVLCLSVNMFNLGFTATEFQNRVRYLLEAITKAHPQKHLFCISLLKSYHDLGLKNPVANPVSTPDRYRNVLETIVKDMNNPFVIYLEGFDLLKTYSHLSHDLLHPGNYGMMEISENLALAISRSLNPTAPL